MRRELGPCPVRHSQHRSELALDVRTRHTEAARAMIDQLKDRAPRNRLSHAGAPSETVGGGNDGDRDQDQDHGKDFGLHTTETAHDV